MLPEVLAGHRVHASEAGLLDEEEVLADEDAGADALRGLVGVLPEAVGGGEVAAAAAEFEADGVAAVTADGDGQVQLGADHDVGIRELDAAADQPQAMDGL